MSFSKKARSIMLSAIGLSLAGVIAFTFQGGQPEIPVPPPPAIQIDAPPYTPVPEQMEIVEEKPHYLNQAGNLLTLTELLAELEVDKLLTALAASREQRAKLESPPLPQVVFPAPSAPPSLVSAPMPSGAVPDALPSTPEPSLPRVMSIQGIDGNVMATVETSSGARALKVGDSFGSGKVESISFMGIHIRDGEQTQIFAIEE
jgi:type IV pilus biogenesis protein PilP